MEDEFNLLEKCELCPRRCKAARIRGEKGYCSIANEIVIAHYGPHYGEEPPISGINGSGTIFFSSCNLSCIFCQNYQISQYREGEPYTIEELVEIFILLEKQGCHNINLVSPTPYIPFIAAAIKKARLRGLGIPFVYNTNAYENVEALKTLDGLIEIYMPDFKYWHAGVAKNLSNVPVDKSYPEYAAAAILEMKRQVGILTIKNNIATRGLLVRHLVLPGNLAGSDKIIEWIRDNLGTDTFISLMSQYYPVHKAGQYPMMNRRIKHGEYGRLTDLLVKEGFKNVFIQKLESAPLFVPDFEKEEPFGDKGR
ncbi:MAG: radical SAM protein [Proteobacteria bacterium]|nr:radical SAM protein [Pseudomonadota bacterium]